MVSTFTPPKSYKAYAFIKVGGDLEPITVPWKDPEHGEIVLKVLACGICASDEIVKYQAVPGLTLPRVPGHEIVGDVVAVPSSETIWKVGQRVGGGWHGGHCHQCHSCRVGDYIHCKKEDINGVNRDGGYAEYVTLRTEAVVAVPDDMDPVEAAPLLCAGITTFNSIRNMGLKGGDLVAIQGIGGLGHLGIQFAHAMGYRTVALSSSDSKRALATQLGASHYIDASKVDQTEALQKLGGANLIVCTAPSSEVIQTLLPALAVDGTLLVLAIPQTNASIPLHTLISNRASIRGWPSGVATDSEDTLLFAKERGVHCMVERFTLDQANEAYNHRATARFRGVIVP